MGARWYGAAWANFLNRDTIFGELSTPISLNRYTYASANPINYWDPTGRQTCIMLEFHHCSEAPKVTKIAQTLTKAGQSSKYTPPPPSNNNPAFATCLGRDLVACAAANSPVTDSDSLPTVILSAEEEFASTNGDSSSGGVSTEVLSLSMVPGGSTWRELVDTAETVSLVSGVIEGGALIVGLACGVASFGIVAAPPGLTCAGVSIVTVVLTGAAGTVSDGIIVFDSCVVRRVGKDCALDSMLFSIGFGIGYSGRSAEAVTGLGASALKKADEAVEKVTKGLESFWNLLGTIIDDAATRED